jgi:hypothetical protein
VRRGHAAQQPLRPNAGRPVRLHPTGRQEQDLYQFCSPRRKKFLKNPPRTNRPAVPSFAPMLHLSLSLVTPMGLDFIFQLEYFSSMKVKTSITLSEDVLKSIDKFSKQYKNRSAFIETASRVFIAQILRDAKNAKDLDIINRRSRQLNEEAEDVLAYQVAL